MEVEGRDCTHQSTHRPRGAKLPREAGCVDPGRHGLGWGVH